MRVTVTIENTNDHPVHTQFHSYSTEFGNPGTTATRREFLQAVEIPVDQIAVEGPMRGWFTE